MAFCATGPALAPTGAGGDDTITDEERELVLEDGNPANTLEAPTRECLVGSWELDKSSQYWQDMLEISTETLGTFYVTLADDGAFVIDYDEMRFFADISDELELGPAGTGATEVIWQGQARGLYEVNDAGIVYTEITSSDATTYSEIRLGDDVEVETEDIGDPIGVEYTCMDGKLEGNPPGLAGQEPPYLRCDPR